MYMTRVTLDMNQRRTQQAFNQPELFHQAVESSFTGPRERRLWRIDVLRGSSYLLLVSKDEPDLTDLATEFGPDDGRRNWEATRYESFLDRVAEGQQWHFRLTANPVKSVVPENAPKGTRGKIVALAGIRDQLQWLWDRADALGVEFDRQSMQVVGDQWANFRKGKGKHRVRFRQVTYEGLLTVQDAERLREMLVQGVGRQKAYGCGLLTLAPPGVG